jgi:branched-chain amino acid transport system permease protein
MVTETLQVLSEGMVIGSIYSLLGLSFVVIYKASGIFNFALGAIAAFDAMLFWQLTSGFGIPLWIAAVLTIGISVFLGFLVERVCLRPLIGQPIIAAILMTLGISIGISSVTMLIWSGTAYQYKTYFSLTPIRFFGISLSQARLFTFIIAGLVFALVGFWLKYSKSSLSIRAVSEDQQAALSKGINVSNVFGQTWAIAWVIAGIAGVLLGFVTVVSGTISMTALKAVPVVLCGGLESIAGAAIVGLAIGVIEAFSTEYLNRIIGGTIEEVIAYVILLAVLMFNPYGLFGWKKIERV